MVQSVICYVEGTHILICMIYIYIQTVTETCVAQLWELQFKVKEWVEWIHSNGLVCLQKQYHVTLCFNGKWKPLSPIEDKHGSIGNCISDKLIPWYLSGNTSIIHKGASLQGIPLTKIFTTHYSWKVIWKLILDAQTFKLWKLICSFVGLFLVPLVLYSAILEPQYRNNILVFIIGCINSWCLLLILFLI